MAASKAEGKRRMKEAEDEEEEERDFEDQIGDLGFRDEIEKKKRGKRGSSGGGGMPAVICQADGCTSDMANAKRYHRRHRVCELHSKAPFVLVAGIQQRFCQQCSRFHELVEFDDSKRSCRRRLAGHNERRRKSSSEFHVYSSN